MKRTLLHTEKDTSRSGHKYRIEFWGGEIALVDILEYPTDALRTLAIVSRGYKGNYTLDPMSEEEMELFAAEIQKTALATPIEFLNFVFLLRDIPRSFTHQLVRTRIGVAYVQESTRFMGAKNLYKVLVPDTARKGIEINKEYFFGIVSSINAYENILSDKEVHSQDARQLLPHAMLTNLFWSINMKALKLVYNQRWCCQAEPSSWLPVMRGVKKEIEKKCGTIIAAMLTAPIDRGESCKFDSKLLDRLCTWKNGNIPE